MLPNLGGWEWVIIAVVALILFGGARLANFGKNAGELYQVTYTKLF